MLHNHQHAIHQTGLAMLDKRSPEVYCVAHFSLKICLPLKYRDVYYYLPHREDKDEDTCC